MLDFLLYFTETKNKRRVKVKRRPLFINADKTIISQKVKEAFSSVLPITAIVLVLCFTIVPIESGTFLGFILGALLVITGMGLFTLGADTAMTPIGEYVGSSVVKTKKMWVIVPVYFLVGVLITISEPDLMVLAGQLKQTIGEWVLIISIGVGVGVFLVIAFLRIILKINLKYLLIISIFEAFLHASSSIMQLPAILTPISVGDL